MTDDDLLAALAELDPTRSDLPPAPGTNRHRSILERSMTPLPTPASTTGSTSPAVEVTRPSRRLGRRYLVVGAAAALVAVVAVLVATVVGGPGGRPDPVAALEAAAAASGDVTSLRVQGTYERSDGTTTIDGVADGRDSDVTFTRPDGSTESRVIIGDQMWDPGEGPDPITVTPDQVNAPFPEASRAVIVAALQGATVDDLGDEDVAGVTATHYSIDLGPGGVAALGELDPTLTAQFELEHPEAVTALDIWIADDLVRRIDVASTVETGAGAEPEVTRVRLEFLDIGVPVDVEPPT